MTPHACVHSGWSIAGGAERVEVLLQVRWLSPVHTHACMRSGCAWREGGTFVLPSQSFEPGETAGLSVGVSFHDAEETYYAKATIQV
eukprot:scaffold34717_cov34-Phaeocystis_antarctica.AAC.1